MGHAKTEMMDAEERGWYEPDGHVCTDCVDDEYLKGVIRLHDGHTLCDYCGQLTIENSAAPVAVLMVPIARAVFHYFNDPTQAGVVYDGEWMATLTGTHDVLLRIRLGCHDQLFADIADAFVYTEWVRAADGQWLNSQPHEELSALWNRFVDTIKHEVRFFFQHTSVTQSATPWERDPQSILQTIADMVNDLDLLILITVNTLLFRVRERSEGATWEVNEDQMGAPPHENSRAGRMNPAGISYLYLALEQESALAEVLRCPPCVAVIAQFHTQRKLKVLDLTNLPELPSIFDDSKRKSREALLFLENFIAEISRPVRKDGCEHIDYVPSQVVCEFFAQIFKVTDDQHLDGIVYPSAVRPGGCNLVLFPTKRGYERSFDQVEFVKACEQSFTDWADFSAALNV